MSLIRMIRLHKLLKKKNLKVKNLFNKFFGMIQSVCIRSWINRFDASLRINTRQFDSDNHDSKSFHFVYLKFSHIIIIFKILIPSLFELKIPVSKKIYKHIAFYLKSLTF